MKISFTDEEIAKFNNDQLDLLEEDSVTFHAIRDVAKFLTVEIPDEIDGESVLGLKSALTRERESRKKAETAQKRLQSQLATLHESAPDEDAIAEAQTKISDLQLKLTASETAISELNGRIKTKDRDSRITATLAKHKGDLDLLRPHLNARLEAEPDLDLEAIIPELREKHPGAFAASAHSGGGSPPGRSDFGSASITTLPTRRSQMTERQKIDHQKQFGLDSLMDIPL